MIYLLRAGGLPVRHDGQTRGSRERYWEEPEISDSNSLPTATVLMRHLGGTYHWSLSG